MMIRPFFFTLLLSCFSPILQAQQLSAMFNYAQFQTEEQAFLETYISIDAYSIQYTSTNETYQAAVEISLLFEQRGHPIYADKYLLNSPEVADTNELNFKFIDQQRIPLLDGEYDFSLSIKDINRSQKALTHQQKISIRKEQQLGFSNIELISEYTPTTTENILSKSGYDMVPTVSNYYPTALNKLNYYAELYHTKEQRYVLQSYIENADNNNTLPSFVKTRLINADNTHPILDGFNIRNLPSGNYSLILEIKNDKQETLCKQSADFIRMNQNISAEIIDQYLIAKTFISNITNADTLKKYLSYLYPIQTPREDIFIKNQMEFDNVELMQKFFYGFWKNRNPLNPELAWSNYKQLVVAVNKSFSNGQFKGYLTDRGRVYLQYGPPNTRNKEYLSNTQKPFEVWHYYSIGQQRNCSFIFTNRNLGNNMDLVLSNVDGENTNFEWLMRFGEEMNDPQFDLNSPLDYFVNPR